MRKYRNNPIVVRSFQNRRFERPEEGDYGVKI